MRNKQIKPLSRADQVYAKELCQVLEEKIRHTVRSNLSADLFSYFEDIVQSIFESICRQLEDFKKCDSQEALAVTIAARATWNFCRDHKSTETLSEDIPATELDRGLEDILPRFISDSDREILTAVYDRQDTMVELAADLGCTPEKLRQRSKRAKARLKRIPEKDA